MCRRCRGGLCYGKLIKKDENFSRHSYCGSGKCHRSVFFVDEDSGFLQIADQTTVLWHIRMKLPFLGAVWDDSKGPNRRLKNGQHLGCLCFSNEVIFSGHNV